MAAKPPKVKIVVRRSSVNVFADLGLPYAEARQTKVRLVVAINGLIERRRFSRAKAAQVLGVNQPRISALSTYRLQGFLSSA